jgi:hypothetical protein
MQLAEQWNAAKPPADGPQLSAVRKGPQSCCGQSPVSMPPLTLGNPTQTPLRCRLLPAPKHKGR